MARIIWDRLGDRYFEYGVDRGVLYVGSSNYGVPWNGLINVNSKTQNTSPQPYYIDGLKYYNEPGLQDFEASIEAYTYPEQFDRCEGVFYDSSGMGYDTQDQETFGLSYRTMIGNDVDGVDHAYKIHIIYNALASAADRANATLTDDPDAITFNWNITTTPILIPGRRPTSHIILDSRLIKSDSLKAVEDILYGKVGVDPRLPTINELSTLLEDWLAFQIVPKATGLSNLDPTGLDDLTGNTDDGLFTSSSGSRLTQTTTPGIYRLE